MTTETLTGDAYEMTLDEMIDALDSLISAEWDMDADTPGYARIGRQITELERKIDAHQEGK